MLFDSPIILILGSVPDFLINILPSFLINCSDFLMAIIHFLVLIIDLSLTFIFSKICGVDLNKLNISEAFFAFSH